MSRSRRVTLSALAALIVCLSASVLLLRRMDRMPAASSLQDVLWISSPKTLRRFSLGYEGLMADIYWTRTVQYFGQNQESGSGDLKLLAPLLEITTALDPHLVVAYEFGANFLAAKPPMGAGMPERAVQLAEYGIRNNPDDWHLYYDLGFVYYMELKNYSKAAEAFARGSELPHTNPALKIMAAQMAQHAGDMELARMLWLTTYQSTPDRGIRANASAHLRAMQVDQDVEALEKRVSLYREKTGRWPSNFSELASSGLLSGPPLDPFGRAYRLMPGGRVEVSDPDSLPFIKNGLPDGYVAPRIPKLVPAS